MPISPNPLGDRLYSFAVISDTHVNPDEHKCNSPFPVNARANRRFRHVVADLNTRDVEFVIHLGDLVHPVPEAGPLYGMAATVYRDIRADLNVPIYETPGNHDIGDTPIKGAPAGPTTPEMIEAWKSEFGAQYQAFSHGGVRFLLINAQLINSGLPDEAEQRDWLEAELAQTEERVMLMLHHPVYLCAPDETEHYDNTDQPGRGWLLSLLEAHGVEAMFSGHAHNFWYDRYRETDFYLAPATSFVRQDYSEMLRARPPEGSEDGRNDAAKLGYFIVNVYENGHVVRFVRTFGAELGPGEALNSKPLALAPAPRENAAPRIGFDLRQNWAEISEVPPSGGLDEFDRKLVRNDYPLQALIEMGVRDVRIPLTDLRDPARLARLDMLRHLGFHPTLFSFGVPGADDLALIVKATDLLADWEMTISWDLLDVDKIAAAHARTGLPIYLSRMRTKDDVKTGGVYFHVINHGFSAADTAQLDQLAGLTSQGVAGAVFRFSNQEPVARTLTEIDEAVSDRGLRGSVHLRVTGDNPAEPHVDDESTETRVAEAMDIAANLKATRVFCDTLADNDRGYFVRNGAIDRCCNPRRLWEIVRDRHAEGRPF